MERGGRPCQPADSRRKCTRDSASDGTLNHPISGQFQAGVIMLHCGKITPAMVCTQIRLKMAEIRG
jgi:dihydroxyacid dehydratase/phosphogluconate dehydratase